MADAVNSTTASVIPFPRRRQPPLEPPTIFDHAGYDKAFVSVRVAEQLVGTSEDATPEKVRDVLHSDEGDGAHVIARTLEHNSFAVGFLSEALAYLVDADRRIAAVAHHELAGAGL